MVNKDEYIIRPAYDREALSNAAIDPSVRLSVCPLFVAKRTLNFRKLMRNPMLEVTGHRMAVRPTKVTETATKP